MAIDLTGIISINEYYTHHYLNTILEEDIKDIIKQLKEAAEANEDKTPWSKLKELSRKFYLLDEKLAKSKNLADRYLMQRSFLLELFNVLGYDIEDKTAFLPVKDNELMPVLHEVRKNNGAPLLWIIESVDEFNNEGEMLHNGFKNIQFESENDMYKSFQGLSFEEIISKSIFSSEEPPRWVLLSSYKEIVVIDRTKWGEKRVLDFKLDDIFSRKEESTLQAMVVLLHKSTICPEEGSSFLDTLSENSHKHASSVSEDLKYALRDCIELLGNEAIRDMRERQRVGVFNRDLASKLTVECLRYMYRILFLLYIEARPELGYAPMKSEEYLKGYSIESLRDVADKAKLDSDEAKNGTYIDKTLKHLFKLIYNGFNSGSDNDTIQGTFKMEPLKAHIFDPDRTELLNKVHFRNEVLIKIIKHMSISRPNGKKRPGRISYAQLGINQLGAVYEALLSYRGFLAEEDLYEVKRAGDKINELEVGYFVTKDQLSEYDEDERVRNDDENKTLKMYPKGRFIYRLAGREREKSASYYTPEVLTKSLVKYALKELLVDKTADDILELTICEPAMGSAAFLNEAVNQLAEKYLELKQKETGVSIPHDEYAMEKQKVKMYIADRNVYGVDLNPIAVELAEVSLWLNTIYSGAYVPWFGLQLVNGNSLVGARKQVYQRKLLKNKKPSELWYNEAPVRVNPGEKRPPNAIYHFLLGDPGMVDYKDKVIKELAKDKIDYMNKWKKDFISNYTEDEIKQLLNLSNTIDMLWEKHAELRKGLREKTKDRLTIFGHNEDDLEDMHLSTKEKDKILKEEYYSEGMMNAGPYARLKFAMDYWCSLWYWPIEKAEMLPTRAEFLLELSLILEGDIIPVKGTSEQMAMGFIEENQPKQQMLDLFAGELGQVDLEMLCKNIPRLSMVQEVAKSYRYLHWELEFADIFEIKYGFDFIIGNPPWLRVVWNETNILGDINPKLVIKDLSSARVVKERNDILKKFGCDLYLKEYEESVGIQNFIKAIVNYKELKGVKSNLYKCFLPKGFYLGNNSAIVSYVHPEGIYDDPKGGILRKIVYPKLQYHFQFINEKNLFQIAHTQTFSLNVYSNKNSNSFKAIFNLFEPKTIDECFETISNEPVLGIKDKNNNWNVAGHQDRVLSISNNELKLFASLYDVEGSIPSEARLPLLHSKQLINVLRSLSKHKKIKETYDVFYSAMIDETGEQKAGTIIRSTAFPENLFNLIYSGPHIGVANPLFKSPRSISKLKADYDSINHNHVIDAQFNYVPRTNYKLNCDIKKYIDKTQMTQWGEMYIESYRIVWRRRLNTSQERTLISAIIPPQVSHINTVNGIAVKDIKKLPLINSYFASLVYDWYIKSTGKGDLYEHACNLPIDSQKFVNLLTVRSLILNCLNKYYSHLWETCWNDEFNKDFWSKKDFRLNNNFFYNLSPSLKYTNVVRNEYIRRHTLVEIDVLVAMALGLSLEDLKTIYRIQFPVLKMYEEDTWYDKNGLIIFTNNKGYTGVKLDRKEWEEVKDMKEGTVTKTYIDNTMPGGSVERTIVYEAPFDRCDREKDYEEVWKNFEERFKNK
ncbi:Eco57I restriction-modification methylase domain-containing protein [Clostridium paraputrificum]|uniref:Eco57I restriction-modification methylase domain-containing protein n=1 Tax=Clostridium paraputrificum TaxID=29363 RepID=UPI00189DA0AE|nr:class I SAM-dependent DNA methyltransferase [Clostridium paraputrificum]